MALLCGFKAFFFKYPLFIVLGSDFEFFSLSMREKNGWCVENFFGRNGKIFPARSEGKFRASVPKRRLSDTNSTFISLTKIRGGVIESARKMFFSCILLLHTKKGFSYMRPFTKKSQVVRSESLSDS